MKYRIIANMRVSGLCLGCIGMSKFYGAPDEAQSMLTLEAAFEAGVMPASLRASGTARKA